MLGEVKRISRALIYSLDGLKQALKQEAAFRTEVIAFVLLLPVVWWLDCTGLEKLVLIGTMVMVMCLELVNSGLEALVDHLFKERHATAKFVKDVGSAAVFLALMLSLVAWLYVLGRIL